MLELELEGWTLVFFAAAIAIVFIAMLVAIVYVACLEEGKDEAIIEKLPEL
jgi:hypothetical protein